jgi:hypothetical protein
MAQHSMAQAGRPAPPPAPVPAPPAADRELAVVNHSRHVVNELYVSPSTADDWGDDKLGDDTLDPGKTFHVKLGRTRDCEFDVQVVYDDASHEETRKVNVCRNRQVAFDGSAAVAAPAANAGNDHPLTVINNDTRPIQQVLISPADAGDWGDDRLNDDSISVGDEKRVPYSGDCVADVRVVFDNRSAEERRGLNLCDSPTLSIEPGWTTADAAPTGPAPTTPHPPAPPPPPPPAARAHPPGGGDGAAIHPGHAAATDPRAAPGRPRAQRGDRRQSVGPWCRGILPVSGWRRGPRSRPARRRRDQGWRHVGAALRSGRAMPFFRADRVHRPRG